MSVTCLAAGFVASAQAPLAELRPDQGWVTYNVGDRDGDGRADLAQAHPVSGPNGWDRGVVFHAGSLRSPRALGRVDVAYERVGQRAFTAAACGVALVVLRDDAEGFEVAIGASGAGAEPAAPGAVETFVGTNRESARLRWRGFGSADSFGAALARIPDVDEDGHDDLAIGAPDHRGRGQVAVVSTRDGAWIAVLAAAQSGERFGAALAATLDVADARRVRRIAVGAPHAGPDRRGAVLIHSLADAALVRTATGSRAGERFGARLVEVDLEDDGSPELLVGSLGSADAPARVCALANGTTERTWTFDFAAASSEGGLSLSACGDLDRDGSRDVIATWSPADPGLAPEFVALSGSNGKLLHRIRGYSFAAVEGPTGSRLWFRDDSVGFQLGRELSASCAGDQDGDGIDDVWLAFRSQREDPPAFGALALLPGRALGASEKPDAPAVERPIGIGAGSARVEGRSGRAQPVSELPALFESVRGEADESRELFGCIQDCWGAGLATLGDLDADGLDSWWASGVEQMAADADFASFVLDPSGRDEARLGDGDFTGAANIGDVDGDGYDDVLIASLERTYRFCEMFGRARVFSSKDWKLVLTIPSSARLSGFAASLASLGDVDGDGLREVALGTPSIRPYFSVDRPPASNAAHVAIVSLGGGKATTVRTLLGEGDALDGFGYALAYGGDWDGDGVIDLAVGAPRTSVPGGRVGSVHVFSGASWRRIAWFAGEAHDEGFGHSLAWVGDNDGDGSAELAVGAPYFGEERRGRVVVLSPKSNGASRQWHGARARAGFGASLCAADFDGDGRLELLVGAPGVAGADAAERGSVSFFSLLDGRERVQLVGRDPVLPKFLMEDGADWLPGRLTVRWGEPLMPGFGCSLAVARNLDGDGVPDLLIGAPSYDTVHALSGAVTAPLLAR